MARTPYQFFGTLGYGNAEAASDYEVEAMQQTLLALQKEIDRGRIRYIGLSNETPWGTMKFLQLAEKLGIDKFVSIQNPYNLLNRTYEMGMSEIAKYEGIGLLAYSPLAFGYLTGSSVMAPDLRMLVLLYFHALRVIVIHKVNGPLNNMPNWQNNMA